MSGFTRTGFARDGFPVEIAANVVGTPQSATGTSGLTVNKPTGTTTGDLIVMAACTRNATLAAPGAGGGAAWTEVRLFDQDTSEMCGLWYKVADGSEPSTYTATMGAGTSGAAAICTFRFPWTTPVVALSWLYDTAVEDDAIIGTPAGYRGGLFIYVGLGNFAGTAMTIPSDFTYVTSHINIQHSTDAQVLIASMPTGGDYPIRRYGYQGGGSAGYRTLGAIVVKGTPS